MKHFKHANELAADMGIPPANLDKTFKAFNKAFADKFDPYGKHDK